MEEILHQLGLVVSPIIYGCFFFHPNGGWPWDFRSINSSNKYIITFLIGNLGGGNSNMFFVFTPIWGYDPI